MLNKFRIKKLMFEWKLFLKIGGYLLKKEKEHYGKGVKIINDTRMSDVDKYFNLELENHLTEYYGQQFERCCKVIRSIRNKLEVIRGF